MPRFKLRYEVTEVHEAIVTAESAEDCFWNLDDLMTNLDTEDDVLSFGTPELVQGSVVQVVEGGGA